MSRTIAILFAAAFAAVAIAPSASAMSWVAPSQPTFHCPVTEPGDGGGIDDEVKDVAHDGTSAACSTVENVKDIYGIAWVFGMEVAGIIIGAIPADELQDAVCRAVYGDPNEPGEPLCKDIVLDLSGVSTDVDLGTW